MLSNKEVEQIFKKIDNVFYVNAEGDGYHYQLTVVTDDFLGKTKVARQQWVYAQLKEYITSGQLHAINMNTWTQEEWGQQHG